MIFIILNNALEKIVFILILIFSPKHFREVYNEVNTHWVETVKEISREDVDIYNKSLPFYEPSFHKDKITYRRFIWDVIMPSPDLNEGE